MALRSIRKFAPPPEHNGVGQVKALAVVRNGTQFIVASENVYRGEQLVLSSTVELWDIETGTCLRSFDTLHRQHVRCLLVLDDDGESFLCGCSFCIIQFNIRSSIRIRQFTTNDRIVKQMQKVDSVSRVVTLEMTPESDCVSIWNIETGHCDFSISFPDHTIIHHMIVLGNERVLLFLEAFHAMILNIGEANAEGQWFCNNGNNVCAVLSLPDSETLLCRMRSSSTEPQDTLALMKTDTGQVIWSCAMNGSTGDHCDDIIPIGRQRVLCCEGDSNTAAIYNIESGKRKEIAGLDFQNVSYTVPLEDDRFLIGTESGEAKLYDCSQWIVVKHFILLRELYSKGRATTATIGSTPHATISVLHHMICDIPDEIFRKIVSYSS